jgi:hypothetical protein
LFHGRNKLPASIDAPSQGECKFASVGSARGEAKSDEMSTAVRWCLFVLYSTNAAQIF